MMIIGNRPVSADRHGITHFAYSWGPTFFDVLCEVYTRETLRETDEPAGTTPTCLRCWYMIICKGAKAKGQI